MSDIVHEAKELYDRAYEAKRDNIELALDDIKFALLSEQWESDDLMRRKLENRPALTINKLPSHIRQVVNDARQNKPRIKINPVDSQADPKTAEIITGLIRNIENISKADIAYDTAIFQAISSGFGYFRVNIDYAYDDTFDLDILIERIPNQMAVVEDPNSLSADGSDWNCCFLLDEIDEDEYEKRYPGKDRKSFDAKHINTSDGKITICEYWKRKEIEKVIYKLSNGEIVDSEVYEKEAHINESYGIVKTEERKVKSYEVTQYVLSGANEPLSKEKWHGKYIPIIPVYGEEIICEGKRTFKSLIRDSKDSQRMYNFWRTTATEAVAKMPKGVWLGEEGAFSADPDKWATVNARNHAYIQHKKGTNPPVFAQPAQIPAGAIQEAMSAADDIQATMGMFNASIGEQGNERSGKAIIERKRESDTGTFHFIDNLSRSIRHAGCVVLDLIPKIFTNDRVVRVIGEDPKDTELVALGQMYRLDVGKYDVSVSSGANYTTQRQEAASQMVEFLRVYPQAAGIMGDLVAKNLDWPGADEIAERMRAMIPQENPQLQQMQQQMQALSQQMQQLAMENQSLKQDKSIDAYKAETDRLKVAQTAGMTPEQVQSMIMQTLQQLTTPGAIDVR